MLKLQNIFIYPFPFTFHTIMFFCELLTFTTISKDIYQKLLK